MSRGNGNTMSQQLGAYKEFAKSFKEAMKSGQSMSESLKESSMIYQRIIGENLKTNMRNDYQKLGDNLKEYQKFMHKYKVETQKDIDELASSMEKLYDNKEEVEKMRNNFKEAMEDMKEESEEASNSISSTFSKLASILQAIGILSFFKGLDDSAKSLIESTNSLQRVGIGSYSKGESYREFLGDTISGLNSDTGGKYNLKDMYSDLATLAETTSISRMDTLKEITRPTLLAAKSMNVSLDTIAQLTGKMYEFAGMDSYKLEGMLNYVRGISNTMNVDEQTIIGNMTELQDVILAYANNRGMGTNQIEALTKDIADMTTLLESSGIDSTGFTSTIKEFLQNPYQSALGQRAGMLGYSSPDELMNQLLSDGGINTLINRYSEFISEGMEEALTNGTIGSYTDSLFLTDTDNAIDWYNAYTRGLLDENSSRMSENLKDMTTMVESVEDQEISLVDSISNKMSTALELLADIREVIGLGFTEVIALIATAYSLKTMFGKGGNGFGSLLGKGGSMAAGGGLKGLIGSYSTAGGGTTSGLLGAAEMGGFNLSGGALTGGKAAALGGVAAGGVAAGAAGAYYGISKGIDDIKEGDTGLGATNIAGGAAMGVGAAALGAGLLGVGAANFWNPVGWVALIAGAATLAGAAIYEAVTPVSGAAKEMSYQVDVLKNNFIDEQAQRLDHVITLKEAIKQAETDTEARKIAVESGLLPLQDAEIYTKDQLLLLADAAAEATLELSATGEVALETSKELLNSLVSDDTTRINDEIYKAVKSLMKDEELTKKNDQTNFAKTYQGFLKQAEAVKDEDARKEAIEMVDTIFSNDVLSLDELKVLTDKGGSWNAFWRTDVDRDRAASRQASDFAATNHALAYFGVDGYQVTENTIASLATAYKNWGAAITEEDKELYKTEFETVWKSMPETYQEGLREAWLDVAKDMGISSFRVGTNYVTHDQLAYIHEGEAIVPKEYNPAANITELETLRSQSRTGMIQQEESLDRMINALESLLGKVGEILTIFNEYSENTNKRHLEDKNETTITNIKNTMYSRLSGVSPSTSMGGGYI